MILKLKFQKSEPAFCDLDSISLTANGGDQYTNYTWFENDIQLNDESKTINVLMTEPTVYKVVAENIFGNSDTSQIEIGIDFFNEYEITSTNSTHFCIGDSTSLSIPQTINYSYSWIKDDTLINDENESIYTAYESGIYQIIYENASGCIDTSSSILIQVNNLPEPEIIFFGTDVYCFGDTIIASVSNDYSEYLWSNGSNLKSINLNNSGQYSVTVSDSIGCSSIAQSNIELPNVLVTSIDSLKNVSCFNGNDAYLSLIVSGCISLLLFLE